MWTENKLADSHCEQLFLLSCGGKNLISYSFTRIKISHMTIVTEKSFLLFVECVSLRKSSPLISFSSLYVFQCVLNLVYTEHCSVGPTILYHVTGTSTTTNTDTRVATFEKNCGTVRKVCGVWPLGGGDPRRCPHVRNFYNWKSCSFRTENHFIKILIFQSTKFCCRNITFFTIPEPWYPFSIFLNYYSKSN